MKNIKVSFHHIDFIYRFRIDLLAYNNPNALVSVDFQSVSSKFQRIRDTLILTGEQLKMLDALSLTFKKQFIKKYEMAMSQRKQKLYPGICMDYLGKSAIQHFQTIHSKIVEIAQIFQKKQALKLVKELYIYQMIISKSIQTIKQEHFMCFCSARLLITIRKLINNTKKQSWEQTEAYTFYYCLISFISFMVKNRRSEDSSEMLRIGSIIGAICYKEAKQRIRYSMLSEIGTLVYEIMFIRLSEQKTVEWIYFVEEEKYQVLQIIIKSMEPLNRNIILLDNAVTFIQKVRLKINSLNELLFFITACINSKFISILEELYERYRLKNFQSKQTLQVGFSDEIADNFGNKIIRLTKKQISEKKWNKLYRQGSNIIIALREKFQQFRAGKILMKSPRKLSMKQQKQKIQQEIKMVQNFQICQSHHAHEEQQLIKKITYHQINQNKQLESKCQILYDDNQQLIKINKWYEQLVNEKSKIIRQLEEAVAQFVNINLKTNKCLSTSHQVCNLQIQPTLKPNNQAQNTLHRTLNSTTEVSNQLVNQILPPPPPPPAYLRNSNNSNTRRNSQYSRSSQQLKHILPPPPPPPIIIPPEFTLPPPPSPMPVFEIQRNSTSRVKGSENEQMKQIKAVNWTTVEISRVKDSFWENITEVQVDENQLLQFFSKKPPEPIDTFRQEKMELKSLLNPARAKNIEIILKKIKINVSVIPEAIEMLNDDILSKSNVESLLKTLPTEKQIQEFNEISVKPSQLSDWSFSDRYFLTIMGIPNYSQILNGIKFKHDFPEIRRGYQKNIQQFIEFFTKLQSDDFLKNFFREMLSIGNYMNQYNAKGTAFGFRFESIQRTYHITSQNNSSTLFQYILNSMKKRGVSFPDEVSYYKSTFIVPIEVLRNDLKDLRKMCENVQQCLLRSHEEDSRTPQYFLSFYIEAREQINLLEQKFNIAYKTAKQVADYYCEKIQVEKIVKELNQFKGRVKRFMEKNRSSKFII